MRRPLPTLDEVNEHLLVNTRTGRISYRTPRGRGRRHAQAGALDSSGRRVVNVSGRRIYAHRLVWFVAKGAWPRSIEHLDGDLDRNCISNLADIPKAIQTRTLRRLRSRTASGRLGVRRLRRPVVPGLPFKAEHRNEHLGYFATAEAAEAAVIQRTMTTGPEVATQ